VARRNNQVVGLDIGTTKISAVIGELSPEGKLEVIGVGHRVSKGLRKGVVVDVDAAAEAVALALEDAEVMAGVRVDHVYVGLGGGQVEALTAEGAVELATKEVTPRDIKQVLAAARPLTPPEPCRVLQVVPIEFRLDEARGIVDPRGMAGSKLAVVAQVISAAMPAIDTLLKALQRVKVGVRDIVAHQLAAARAALTEDEKQLGVALLDLGGGTTDLAVYAGGTLRHLASLPVGGNHVTHDLAVGLRTPVAEAERLKKQYGCARCALIQSDDTVDVPVLGAKAVQPTPRKLLGEIIECRIEEVLTLALQRLQQSGCYGELSAGLVLTGGGALLPGMVQAAEAIFELPVRLGVPVDVGGLSDLVHSPIHATSVGLALWGADRLRDAPSRRGHPTSLGVWLRRMASWWQRAF
jgi:cell division protein FtsA